MPIQRRRTLSQADMVIYQAKKRGRNQAETYTPEK